MRLSTWLRGLDHTSPREAVTNYTKDGVCAPERPRRPTDRLRSERLRNSRSRRPISRSIPIARVIGLDKSQRNRTCEFRADTGSALRMGCGSPGNRVDRVTVASECERHEHRDRPVGRYCLFHFQTPSQVLWADGPTSRQLHSKGLSLSHKGAGAQSIVALLSTAYDTSALCVLATERFLPLSPCNRGDKTLQTSCDISSAKLSDT